MPIREYADEHLCARVLSQNRLVKLAGRDLRFGPNGPLYCASRAGLSTLILRMVSYWDRAIPGASVGVLRAIINSLAHEPGRKSLVRLLAPSGVA